MPAKKAANLIADGPECKIRQILPRNSVLIHQNQIKMKHETAINKLNVN